MCFCMEERTVLMKKDPIAYTTKDYKKNYAVKNLENQDE